MSYKRYKNENFSKIQGGKFDKDGKINPLLKVSLKTLNKLKENRKKEE